jgi:hypothetical protein
LKAFQQPLLENHEVSELSKHALITGIDTYCYKGICKKLLHNSPFCEKNAVDLYKLLSNEDCYGYTIYNSKPAISSKLEEANGVIQLEKIVLISLQMPMSTSLCSFTFV